MIYDTGDDNWICSRGHVIYVIFDLLEVFGPWYDHVNGYWEKKQTYSNLHYMLFEDMVEVRSLSLDFWANKYYVGSVVVLLSQISRSGVGGAIKQ